MFNPVVSCRLIIGLSGGLDSAVCAYFSVIGWLGKRKYFLSTCLTKEVLKKAMTMHFVCNCSRNADGSI